MNGTNGRTYKLPHREQVQLRRTDQPGSLGWILIQAIERFDIETWVGLLIQLEREKCPPEATDAFAAWVDESAPFLNCWFRIDPIVSAQLMDDYGAIEPTLLAQAQGDPRIPNEHLRLMRNFTLLRKLDRKGQIKGELQAFLRSEIPVPEDRALIERILNLAGITPQGNFSRDTFRSELAARSVTVTKGKSTSFRKEVLRAVKDARPRPKPVVAAPLPPVPRPPRAEPLPTEPAPVPQGSQTPGSNPALSDELLDLASEIGTSALESGLQLLEDAARSATWNLPDWWYDPVPAIRCSEIILAKRRTCEDAIDLLTFDISVVMLRIGAPVKSSDLACILEREQADVRDVLKLMEAAGVIYRTGQTKATLWHLA